MAGLPSLRSLAAGAALLLLGAAALAGLALSAGFLVISTEAGRSLLLPRLLEAANQEIAGRLSLGGFAMGRGGALELRELRLAAPDGEPVVEVAAIRGSVDLSRLRSRRISLRLEVEGPRLTLRQDAAGRLNLEAALAPRRPRPPAADEPLAWSVRIARLEVRGGEVSWRDERSGRAVRAGDLALDARGAYGPRGGRGELALRGALREPAELPLSLDARAVTAPRHLALPVLRVRLGDTSLELVAEGDPEGRRGRAAAVALRVQGADLRPLVPGLALGDLGGRAYAEADGRVATAALEARPGDGKGGSADAALALRLPPAALAAGFDLRLDRLDPARVAGFLPPGELRLGAVGHVAGEDLRSLRGALRLGLGPSRLRQGRLGPAQLRAQAAGGTVEVTRLEAALPGAALKGKGTWRPQGALDGALGAELADLQALTRDLSALGVPGVPRLSGSARAEVGLSGTAAAPVLKVKAAAPAVSAPGASAAGLALDAELSGSRAAPRLRLEASLARLSALGLEARNLSARARLEGLDAEAGLSVVLPEAGQEPFALRAAGRFDDDRRAFTLSEAGLAWPGTRFALEAPARVRLEGPRVDRLALRSGPERLVLEGGLTKGRLDVRAVGTDLDLARLPQKLLPEGLGLAGRVSFQAEASGDPAAPLASAHLAVAGAAARGLSGVDASADLRLDGPARRATAAAAVHGLAGAEVELRADLPLDLFRPRTRLRPAEPVSLSLDVRGLRLAEALAAARVEAPADGRLDLALALSGTAGSPAGLARATLAEGRYGEVAPLALRAELEAPGSRARLAASADHGGARAAEVEVRAPLDLAAALRDPAAALRSLRRAPLEAELRVPGLELAPLARQGALPEGTAGRLTASAAIGGTLDAPRGTARVALADGAAGGWKHLSIAANATARDAATAFEARAGAGGQEALALEGTVGAPLERLLDPAGREAAPLTAEGRVQGLELTRLEGPVALTGRVTARLGAAGTLGAPELTLSATGEGAGLGDRALGDLSASARAGREGLTAEAALRATSGGRLQASLRARSPVTPRSLAEGTLAEAPARAEVSAEALDLSLLPALAPGLVRGASGRLDAHLEAEGPLARLRPRGTVRLTDGKALLAGLGEWHGLQLEASADADAVVVSRLEARRGRGSFRATARVAGLSRAGAPADLSGELHAARLLLSADGQDLVTLDLDGKIRGTVDAAALDADLEVERGEALLPRRTPRSLQSLEPRRDIVVKGPERRRVVAGPPGKPYRASLRLLVPATFRIRSDQPQANVGLRGELRLTQAGGPLLAEGSVDVTDGFFEESGRLFVIRRASAAFDGGEATRGVVEAEATYDNPVAKVTISASGPVSAPVIKMTSVPPLDEAQIAMLIVTGRTETKAGAGAAGPPTGTDAGYALLGTVATQALQTTLNNKLPVDLVAFDSGQLRMGKYISDKIYVGYTRRFNANPEQGENANEMKVEYQVSPRWTLESRYGDANTGSASIIWSKDY